MHPIFDILYFPQFNLSFEKKIDFSQNAQKSPKDIHKTAKLWLMKYAEGFSVAWKVTEIYSRKVVLIKRRQNSLHAYPRLHMLIRYWKPAFKFHA